MCDSAAERLFESWSDRPSCRIGKKIPERALRIAQNELHILFGVFLRKRTKSKIHEVLRLNSSIQQFFPKRNPRGAASERILESRQMLQQKNSAGLIQRKVAIRDSAARRQNELR